VTALCSVADYLVQTGMVELAADTARQALQAAEANDAAGDAGQAFALREAVAALAMTGQGRLGLQVTEGIHKADDRARALRAAAQALADIGQTDEASRVAADIDDPVEKAGAQNHVAMSLAQAGQIGQCYEAAEQALRTAAAIRNPGERAWPLADLLSNPAISSGDSSIGRRTLEQLLLTASAPRYLAQFPVALLWRLVTSGELGEAGRSRS
jgi:hypothetical protein